MDLSTLSDDVRRTLVQFEEPYRGVAGVVPDAPPVCAINTSEISVSLSEGHAALREFAILGGFSGSPYHSRICLLKEAIASSAIEGVTVPFEQAVHPTDQRKASQVVALVRGYASTLQSALAVSRFGGASISVEDVQGLHRTLMAFDPNYIDTPGKIRERVVWIGGSDIANSRFNPPPPTAVMRCMVKHMRYLSAAHEQEVRQDIITRLAVGHCHFETIHPFSDGNGRVGRMLIAITMASAGHQPVLLSPFLLENRERYYGALAAAQTRLDYLPMIALLADGIRETLHDAKLTMKAFAALIARWRTTTKFRKGSTASDLLPYLLDNPVVSIGDVAKLLKVSFPAASAAIERLMSAEILSPASDYARNRIFIALDVMALHNRPFGVSNGSQ